MARKGKNKFLLLKWAYAFCFIQRSYQRSLNEALCVLQTYFRIKPILKLYLSFKDFFDIFLSFILCNFSVRTLQYL